MTSIFSLRETPELEILEFLKCARGALDTGAYISSFFALPERGFLSRLIMVLSHTQESTQQPGPARKYKGKVEILTSVPLKSYASLTQDYAQAAWFEREIAEQYGIIPLGHPWLKSLRFHKPLNGAEQVVKGGAIGDASFFSIPGFDTHEVAVGPVHAGVIEPGHFRFQCHGETVFHLEISLGYQYRGLEARVRKLLSALSPGKGSWASGGIPSQVLPLMEVAAGDTSIGHSWAFCELLEIIGGSTVPGRALVLRAVMLELERMANHTGDLGALAGDIGYLPTHSFCGRLRGEYLNMSALVCGSRFGRRMLTPGGVFFDMDLSLIEELSSRLTAVYRDTAQAVGLLWNTPSVLARFEHTGTLTKKVALDLGLVGPAARACGLPRDVRHDFPDTAGLYENLACSVEESGDVFARAKVRSLELEQSVRLVQKLLSDLPEGSIRGSIGNLRPDSLAVSLIEGWRGEICHVMTTDGLGVPAYYKITDPSFHNWQGLAQALRDQQISDFPLCNKSFNLSYCGQDL